jgi:hypothetical protein
MNQDPKTELDEDLTPRFRWRWGEHGIYLGVCSTIGLLVLGLYMMPRPPKRPIFPMIVETIRVRYIAAADEPPEKEDPFHDPRVIRPFVKAIAKAAGGRSM